MRLQETLRIMLRYAKLSANGSLLQPNWFFAKLSVMWVCLKVIDKPHKKILYPYEYGQLLNLDWKLVKSIRYNTFNQFNPLAIEIDECLNMQSFWFLHYSAHAPALQCKWDNFSTFSMQLLSKCDVMLHRWVQLCAYQMMSPTTAQRQQHSIMC